jgi:putative spermidine/putrescine transport system permease protein
MKNGLFIRFVAVLVYAFLLGPLIFVTVISFSADSFIVFPPSGFSTRWYAALFGNARIMTALRVSALVAATVTLIALMLAVPAAYALVRGRFRGRALLFGFITSPLILPTVVVGLGILIAFASVGLVATWPGLILAHLVLTIPFCVRILATTLSTLPPDVEDAAAMLGATPMRVFRRVTLPLMAPGLISAGLLTFILSFDEIVITLFIAGPRLYTLPVEVFSYVSRQTDPLVAALSVALVSLSVLSVLAVERLMGFAKAMGR